MATSEKGGIMAQDSGITTQNEAKTAVIGEDKVVLRRIAISKENLRRIDIIAATFGFSASNGDVFTQIVNDAIEDYYRSETVQTRLQNL